MLARSATLFMHITYNILLDSFLHIHMQLQGSYLHIPLFISTGAGLSLSNVLPANYFHILITFAQTENIIIENKPSKAHLLPSQAWCWPYPCLARLLR